jgi:GntR family transcriptional regulator
LGIVDESIELQSGPGRSGEPIFAQLIRQIRQAVSGGELKPSTPLPAIRQPAADLQINPNTVAKSYGLLERDGVIETRGRSGSFVHRKGRKNSRQDRSAQAPALLADTVNKLRGTGLTDSEIRNAFAAVMRG